jgi:hypothetical protein
VRKLARAFLVVMTVLTVVAALYGARYGYYRWEEAQARDVFDNAAAAVTTGSEVIGIPKHPNGGLVVYAHRSGQHADSVRDSEHAQLVAALMNAGYVVAASDAGGNAWGNLSSVEKYLDLIREVKTSQRITGTYLIGESMGGLPSLQLLDRVSDIRAWVGISPVTDARSIMGNQNLNDGLTAAYADNPPGKSKVTPVQVNNIRVPLLMFASPEDRTVPKKRNTDALAAAMQAKGDQASVVSTRGDHGDLSNIDSARIVGFFSSRQ